MSNKQLLFLSFVKTILMASMITSGIAQTGPGGVGFENDSEENQPWNVLWLKADALSYENGETVETWDDKSGNGNDAVKMDEQGPVFNDHGLNGQPCVTFNGTNYMSVEDADNLDGGDGLSIFAVIKKNHDEILGGRKIIAKRKHWNVWSYSPPLSPSDIQYSYGLDYRDTEEGSRIDCHINGNLDDIKNRVSTDYLYGDSAYAYLINYNYNGNWAFIRVNGVSNTYPGGENPKQVSIGPVIEGTADLWIGAAQLDPPGHKSADEGITVESFLNANISEIIIYRSGLDSCQILIVENYLATKYNLPMDSASRFFQDTVFTSNVFGIGTINGITKHTKASDFILQIEEMNGTLDQPNEFLFAGNNSLEITMDTTFIPETVTNRWSRIWKIEKTGRLDSRLSFNFFEAGMTMEDPDNYVLLYSEEPSSPFIVLPWKVNRKFSSLYFEIPDNDLKNGYYTLGYLNTSQPISAVYQQTDHSIKIYPNPVTDNHFNLELWDNYTGQLRMEIYNLHGKVLLQEQRIKKSNRWIHQVPNPSEKGVYILKIIYSEINQIKRLYFIH